MVLKTKANYKALKLCKLTPFDMVLPTKITVEPIIYTHRIECKITYAMINIII
jgi:hypothetical protein